MNVWGVWTEAMEPRETRIKFIFHRITGSSAYTIFFLPLLLFFFLLYALCVFYDNEVQSRLSQLHDNVCEFVCFPHSGTARCSKVSHHAAATHTRPRSAAPRGREFSGSVWHFSAVFPIEINNLETPFPIFLLELLYVSISISCWTRWGKMSLSNNRVVKRFLLVHKTNRWYTTISSRET